MLAKEKAWKNLRIADHMLTQTYPLVNDPKLLLAILENLFLGLTNAMAALLYFERLQKKIPPFQDNFDSKYNMLRMHVAKTYKIPQEFLQFIYDVKDIVASHKRSPVEFVRKDVFVICTESYSMKTISVEEMKQFIAKAKVFIQEVSKIVSQELPKEVP